MLKKRPPSAGFWSRSLSSVVRGHAPLMIVFSLLVTVPLLTAAEPSTRPTPDARRTLGDKGVRAPGFKISPHFDEQIRSYRHEPGVSIHVNAPSAAQFKPDRPYRVIIYALPNGNTTDQTIGKRPAPGVAWHYGIQHIGAQTRRLREVIQDENIVVAYVEADGRSWPAWRSKHAKSGQYIGEVIDSISRQFAGLDTRITLTGHSGGGSFTFGYINSIDRIPDWIDRIAFLDSNYGYSAEQKHADKLLAWLKADRRHHLVVIAYDDRNIMLDGKRVVGPNGGTYRRTVEMVARFRQDVRLSESPILQTAADSPTPTTGPAAALAVSKRYRGMDGQIDILLVENPQNKILHTVLVGDMSGYIHAVTSGTPYEDKVAIFGGPLTYEKWIQAD